MLDRFQRSFPHDHRLAATEATRQAWHKLISIDRAIGTFRTTASASVSIARTAASTITNTIRSKPSADSTRRIPSADDPMIHDRESVRSKHEWAGTAAMVIGPTSANLRAGQPWHRRVLRSDRVVGFPDGWLRITPNDFLWSPIPSRAATAEVVQLDSRSLADVELVALGRRRAGLTITTRSGTELWLLIADRRKVDEMLQRLRYRDRS
ncbi:MAG: hypothetical protein GXP35_11150 [Actinobacteria bacterium]|nr:hypothetical protein [Actinomycetota bacterium]